MSKALIILLLALARCGQPAPPIPSSDPPALPSCITHPGLTPPACGFSSPAEHDVWVAEHPTP